jgi:predicted glutamine amidotransferase
MTNKKSVRAGHRGAVRKLITQIEENSTENGNLEGFCETLKRKRDSLSQLDAEILDETPEESMGFEIEDADRYTIDVERTLAKVRNVSNLNYSKSTNGVHTSQRLNPNATEFLYINSDSSSSMLNNVQFRPSMHISNSSSYHKLPKLNLTFFDGNLLNWQQFWDAFQSIIHDNSFITDVQKFSYLKNQLQGIAAQCIAGLPLTTGNYYQAVEILRRDLARLTKLQMLTSRI